MPHKEEEDIKLKISVILYLIGTIFQTARSRNVLSREQWIDTAQLIFKVLELVDTPEFKAALKLAHEGALTSAKGETEEAESIMTEESGLIKKVLSNTKQEFEIERSVFPSLSNFLERLDD